MVWDSQASGNAIPEGWVGFRIPTAHIKSAAGSGRLRRPSSQPAAVIQGRAQILKRLRLLRSKTLRPTPVGP